jgi:hypothetical protein
MKPKVCLIGHGVWGKVLYKRLKTISNVIHILDSKNYSFKKIKDADWVLIATPNKTHYKIIIDSIRLKKNVLCEKPLVINYSQAKILYNFAKKNNVKLIVSDLSEYKKKIDISSRLNVFKRFKNSPKDKNLTIKRFDLLYRYAYHDIEYIYDHIKNKKLNLIKINCSEKILDFTLKFNKTSFSFIYNTQSNKKIHTFNNKNLNQKKDIIKKMLHDHMIKKNTYIRNKKKSLFIIKILERIKLKI